MVASAILRLRWAVGADELITMEKPGKPFHRVREIPILQCTSKFLIRAWARRVSRSVDQEMNEQTLLSEMAA